MLSETPGRVAVRVLAWGESATAVECAVSLAGWGPSRQRWRFATIERFESAQCPLNMQDPKMIAADAGQGWAYAVYRAGFGDG